MRYYIVTDIHGFYSELVRALREAGFFDDKGPCKVIVCGDILDRGREAAKTVDFLLELAGEDKLILIKGNHEELFVHCLQDIARGRAFDIACGRSHHYTNRTWDSMLQLAGMREQTAVDFSDALVVKLRNTRFYRELLPLCVDYYETPGYIFCHGWIPVRNTGDRYYPKYSYDPNWREADTDAWYTARWLNGMELACEKGITEPGKTVVCGHWHTSYGHSVINKNGSEWGKDADFSPFYADGIIALDACTAYSKRMNCIVIED